jgi:LGFP repeat
MKHAIRNSSRPVIAGLALWFTLIPGAYGANCLGPGVVTGTILNALNGHGGPNGLLGCPLTRERSTPDGGRFQTFENGQIVVTPKSGYPNNEWVVTAQVSRRVIRDETVWEEVFVPGSGLVRIPVFKSIYADDGITVDWSGTGSHSYEFFQVRWVLDGADGPDWEGQSPEKVKDNPRDCFAEGNHSCQGEIRASWANSYNIPTDLLTSGRYKIMVEGCRRSGFLVFRSTECPEGWSAAIDLEYQGHQTGAANQTTPTPQQWIEDFSYPFMLDWGCRDIPDASEQRGAAYLSKLWMAERIANSNGPLVWCGNKNATALSYEVSKSIGSFPKPKDRDVGTSTPLEDLPELVKWGISILGGGCTVEHGDFDMWLSWMMPMAFRFRPFLHPVDYNYMLDNFFTVRGGADKVRDKAKVCGADTPFDETENHMFMTESSRYLTNQLLWQRSPQNSDPSWCNSVVLPGCPTDNKLANWLLHYMQRKLIDDFQEYNARPYERFTLYALQNLADYAGESRIRTGARLLLDYISAKYALQSNHLRRAAPYRRQPTRGEYGYLMGGAFGDEDASRMALLTGDIDVQAQERRGQFPTGREFTVLRAAIGSYRVPGLIQDYMLNRIRHNYWQRIHHAGVETYWSDPAWLISGGGVFVDKTGMPQILEGLAGDRPPFGLALPTVLIPTTAGENFRELVRIEGQIEGKYNRGRINTCVGPNFACGMNPRFPETIPAPCKFEQGNWTFLDLEGCNQGQHMYVAVYRETCYDDACRSAAGSDASPKGWGFFEVAHPNPLGSLSFLPFVQTVLANNGGRAFRFGALNQYLTVDGSTIWFQAHPDDPMKETVRQVWLGKGPRLWVGDPSDWPLAAGVELIGNDAKPGPLESGVQGCVQFTNYQTGRRLILDFSDALHPRRAEVDLNTTECSCRSPQALSFCPLE